MIQVITAANSELFEIFISQDQTKLDLFQMTVMINSTLDCYTDPFLFDFSNYTKQFELTWKGYEKINSFSACLHILNRKSIFNTLILENGEIFGELTIDLGIKNVEIRNSRGDSLFLYTFIENLLISNSYYKKDAEITHIANVRIVNSRLSNFEIVMFNGNSVEIVNSEINGILDLVNVQSVLIRNSSWLNTRFVSQDYTSSFSLVNSIEFDNVTTNAIIAFISIHDIKMNGLIVRNSRNSYFLYQFIHVSRLELRNSLFEGNQVSNNYNLLSSQMVTDWIKIENCTIRNNTGSFIMITDTNTIMGRAILTFSNSLFQFNTLHDVALIEVTDQTREVYFVNIDHCKFIGNSGGTKGSTLHFEGAGTSITNSEFNSNVASEYGAYFNSYVEIGSSKFINNQAGIGGAIYIGSKGSFDQLPNFICKGNQAIYSGGCVFSEKKLYLLNVNGNTAADYGSNVATPIVSVDVLFELEKQEVYAGQPFQINIFPRDMLNQSTGTLFKQYLTINSGKDFTLAQNSLSGQKSMPFVLQIFPVKITDMYPAVTTLSISITPGNIEKLINITIIPCPNSYFLKESQNGYYCEYVPLSAILSSAILGIILVAILFAGIIVIIRRLWKLRKQERAEREMEQKFKEKEFIFEESPLLANNDSNSINNGSSSNHNDSSTIRNKQQYIIPLSEITISKRIGEGAMGIVYLGKWNRTEVAIKELKTESNNEEFENEAILMSSLRHPCIVNCFGVSLSTNRKYMIVEYLENGSLDRMIYNSKIGKSILRFETKLKILIDVSKGLVYLHSIKPHRIIHRDLKPGNLLLDKSMNAKVGDFGLSKIVSNNSVTMTAHVGTLLYMAPELLSSNQKGQSTKVDVYSFGIIMYELLFEISPFSNEVDGFNVFQILKKVTEGHRPSLLFEIDSLLEDSHFEQWIVHNFTRKQIESLGNENICKLFESFIQLMEQCWHTTASERPEFIEIIDRLENTLLNSEG